MVLLPQHNASRGRVAACSLGSYAGCGRVSRGGTRASHPGAAAFEKWCPEHGHFPLLSSAGIIGTHTDARISLELTCACTPRVYTPLSCSDPSLSALPSSSAYSPFSCCLLCWLSKRVLSVSSACPLSARRAWQRVSGASSAPVSRWLAAYVRRCVPCPVSCGGVCVLTYGRGDRVCIGTQRRVSRPSSGRRYHSPVAVPHAPTKRVRAHSAPCVSEALFRLAV